MFRGLYLRYSSMIMWHLPHNPDSTLIKPAVWCHPVNTWKWRCMSLLVLSVKISSGSRHSELFLLRIHQAVSHCGPIICHLKLPKISWTFLNVVWLWWHRVWQQKKGKHLFMALVCLQSLVSCKSTVIVSPVLVSLDLSSYPLYLPSLPSVGAPGAVIFVCLPKKEKDAGSEGVRVSPSWFHQIADM